MAVRSVAQEENRRMMQSLQEKSVQFNRKIGKSYRSIVEIEEEMAEVRARIVEKRKYLQTVNCLGKVQNKRGVGCSNAGGINDKLVSKEIHIQEHRLQRLLLRHDEQLTDNRAAVARITQLRKVCYYALPE